MQGPGKNSERAAAKQAAAERAVDFVESGMLLGLGAGSTAVLALRRVARLLQDGRLHDIQGFACSREIEAEARTLGIPVILELPREIDLTIDGADEVDPELNLIKGGGGALLREKIVAEASRREIIVVDESKLSPVLGTRWALPVEIVPFGWHSQARFVASLGARPTLRLAGDGSAFTTDQGNWILDCAFGPIHDPEALAAELSTRAGIVEHGLFLGLASELIVGEAASVRHVFATGRG